jgi:hypothetical protein
MNSHPDETLHEMHANCDEAAQIINRGGKLFIRLRIFRAMWPTVKSRDPLSLWPGLNPHFAFSSSQTSAGLRMMEGLRTEVDPGIEKGVQDGGVCGAAVYFVPKNG